MMVSSRLNGLQALPLYWVTTMPLMVYSVKALWTWGTGTLTQGPEGHGLDMGTWAHRVGVVLHIYKSEGLQGG